jgi:hypothetical protein
VSNSYCEYVVERATNCCVRRHRLRSC